MKRNLFTQSVMIGVILLCVGTSFTTGLPNSPEKNSLNNLVKVQLETIRKQATSTSLFFTENKGQFPAEVLFQTKLSEATVYFCHNEIVSVFVKCNEQCKGIDTIYQDKKKAETDDVMFSQIDEVSIVASFFGANTEYSVIGTGDLSHRNNYFIGDNPDCWRTDVRNFREILYKNIYPGIDLRYYFQGMSLKYEFVVHPGGNPSQIMIRYTGIKSLMLTSDGDLALTTRFGEIREQSPVIYQNNQGVRREIPGRYILCGSDVFSFSLDRSYDTTLPLIIDPTVVYSTYLGGTGEDRAWDVAIDSEGHVYVTGITLSPDFPTVNPFNGTLNGSRDIFISKLNPASSGNSSLLYSTYLGGADEEAGWNIAVDTNQNIYVTGWTNSSDFPLVNSYQDTCGGNKDVCLVKLSPMGDALLFSTYLGGTKNESGDGIAVTDTSVVSITGFTQSLDFPTTMNAYDITYNGGPSDAFVSEIDTITGGSISLMYSTYLGGTQEDVAEELAMDVNENVYICGCTNSLDFPMNNSYDASYNGGGNDSFVMKIDPSIDGNPSLVYSTYLGGSSVDMAFGIAVSKNGNAYVTGYTFSTDFPMKNAYQPVTNGIAPDAFVTIMSPDGKYLVYSTYLGGLLIDVGYDVAVGIYGSAYVIGATQSYNFPIRYPLKASINGDWDVFVAKLSPSESGSNSLIFSTYFGDSGEDRGYGGIAVDLYGDVYIAGYTSSFAFPVKNAYNAQYNGNYDAFVSKFTLSGIKIDITKPQQSLYVNDIDVGEMVRKIIPSFRWPFVPWIFGNISIITDAVDDFSGIHNVELYIDNVFQGNATVEPYSWVWHPETIGKHTIKVIAYTNEEISAFLQIMVRVWKTG